METVGPGSRRSGGVRGDLDDEVRSRAAEMRSRNGMVGITPPASSRDSAGWVMPAQAASSTSLDGAQGRSQNGTYVRTFVRWEPTWEPNRSGKPVAPPVPLSLPPSVPSSLSARVTFGRAQAADFALGTYC